MDLSLRTSEALARGITRDRLRGPSWNRVSHGLYAPRTSPPDESLVTRCAELGKILPAGAAMAHLTAARIYTLPLPRLPPWLPTQAVVPPGALRPERAGVYVFRSRCALPPPTSLAGLAVLPVALCLAQLAEDLSLIDLVVAVDDALRRKLCTIADITAGLRSRQRGLPMLRQAMALCDERSESPWETVLRVLHVTSGIQVEPQEVVTDDEGRFIARADLRIRGTRRLPEYDGGVHRETEQHQADLARDKALARAHWERYGYTAKEILSNPDRVIRDAEEAMGLHHDAGRLATWRYLVGRSSLTIDGRVRLARRLHRFDRPLRGRKPRAAPKRPAFAGERAS